MPKAQKLSKKERDFAREYAKTGNGTKAALKVYDTQSENTAAVIATENLRKPKIIDAVKSFADRIPDDLLEKVHLEGLAATQVRFTPEGEQIDVPDYSTRHKYVDTAHKIKGTYAPEKSVNVNIDVETTSEIRDAADKLNALYRGSGEPSDGTISSPVGEEVQNKE